MRIRKGIILLLIVLALIRIAAAVSPVPTLDPTNGNNVQNNITSFNMLGTIQAVWGGYVGYLGNMANLVLWLILFSMYYIRQGNATLPAIMGFIFGGIIIGMIPEDFQLYATGAIIITGAAIVFLMFTEKH